MNKYYKFKQYPEDFYAIIDDTLYHYFTLASKGSFYKVRFKADISCVMEAVGGKLKEISETEFLRLIISQGVIDVEQ